MSDFPPKLKLKYTHNIQLNTKLNIINTHFKDKAYKIKCVILFCDNCGIRYLVVQIAYNYTHNGNAIKNGAARTAMFAVYVQCL